MRTTLVAGLVLAMSVSPVLAVDPDSIRGRAPAERPLEVPAELLPTPAQQADALSDAFKKFSTMHLLMWRVSGSGNLMIMGQFTSLKHCQRARTTLRGQVVRLGWGRVECLEIVVP